METKKEIINGIEFEYPKMYNSINDYAETCIINMKMVKNVLKHSNSKTQITKYNTLKNKYDIIIGKLIKAKILKG